MPFSGWKCRNTRAAKDSPISTGDPFLDEVPCLDDGCESRVVAFLIAFAPGDESMLSKNDELRVRIGTHRQSDFARQAVTGTAIGNPDQRIAKTVSCELFAALRTGEIIRCIRVCMVNMRKWQESMQERLDGWAWPARLIEAMGQVLDHLRIAHAAAFQ